MRGGEGCARVREGEGCARVRGLGQSCYRLKFLNLFSKGKIVIPVNTNYGRWLLICAPTNHKLVPLLKGWELIGSYIK